MRANTIDDFWNKVEIGAPDDCWNWTSTKLPSGYGRFSFQERKLHLAHRFAYELIVGPIPSDLELDHLCRNKSCVNPRHLEPVTHQENMRRSRIGVPAQERCRHGHPLSGENLYVTPMGKRQCRICLRRNSLAHYYRTKENQ